MSTEQLKAMTTQHNHAVGNLNSLKVKTVANGAIVDTADIDNFTLGELSFNADGERIVKQLSDVTKKSYLVAAPENRYMGEAMTDFFNAVGDRVRVVVLEAGYTRFDTSAFDASGVSNTIANGQVAYFDTTSKKFIILPANTADTTYPTASAKFLVVSNEDELAYTFGVPMVRLEVQEA